MAWLAEVLFQPVERLKQRVEVRFICSLSGREACLIHAVINRMIHPVIHFINLLAQMLRIEAAAELVRLAQVLRQQMVEFRIEHADDLTALIVDDRLGLLIPESRDCEATDVVRVRLAVEVSELREAVQRVLGRTAVTAVEDPAVLCQLKAADDELDERLETLERADEVRAVRPWAAPIDVEHVAVRFGGEPGVGVAGDEVAELAVFAPELAVLVGVFVNFGL